MIRCVIVAFALFFSILPASFPLTNAVPAPVKKHDINNASYSEIREIFQDAGLNQRLADQLLSLRKKRGEIRSFPELLEAGFTEAELEKVKSVFTVNSLRVDPDSILKTWNVSDTEYFYGLLVYPMDLNSAEAGDLKELPCFGTDGAVKIASYRATNEIGALLELTNAGIVKEKLLQASPFVTMRPVKESGLNMNADIRCSAGRSILSNDDVSADTGELEFRTTLVIKPVRVFFATASTNLPISPTNFLYNDWYADSRYYASVNSGPFQLIAGHYRLRFGRNLLFGPVFPSLSQEIGRIDIGKDDKGAVPCTSLSSDGDNNGARDFFNGFALTAEFRDIDFADYRPSPRITGFYSYFDNGVYGGYTNQCDYGADIRIGLFENSTVGFTASSQYRADGKFSGTGLSLRYDIAFPEILEIYSEIAGFTGYAGMQGMNLRAGPWKISLLGFYAATNYLAPNASDIVHAHRDAFGYYAGLGYEFPSLELEVSADGQWKVSTPDDKPRQTVQLLAKFQWDDTPEWLDGVEIETRARYSDNNSGVSVRSFLNGNAEFFGSFLSVEAGWQDLQNFTVNETGDMWTVRVRIAVPGFFAAVFRWNGYSSVGYHSALYDTSEAAYPGDLSVQPYYGRGNEFSLTLKWEAARELCLDCGIHGDFRADRKSYGLTARTAFAF